MVIMAMRPMPHAAIASHTLSRLHERGGPALLLLPFWPELHFSLQRRPNSLHSSPVQYRESTTEYTTLRKVSLFAKCRYNTVRPCLSGPLFRIRRHQEEIAGYRFTAYVNVMHTLYIQITMIHYHDVCSIIRFPRLSGYFCGKRMCAAKRGLTVPEVSLCITDRWDFALASGHGNSVVICNLLFSLIMPALCHLERRDYNASHIIIINASIMCFVYKRFGDSSFNIATKTTNSIVSIS